MKQPNGSTTLDPRDSMDVLLDTHLPGSSSIRHNEDEVTHNSVCRSLHREAEFFTVDKIATAIRTFGDYKVAGPDGIAPCVLKHLEPVTLNRLKCLYQASYLLGYIPESWKEDIIIFIPKAGKTDYNQPHSFRPITLSSFVMKDM